MEETDKKIDAVQDRKVENIMGSLLRAGVVTAALLVFAGAVYFLIKYGGDIPDYSSFKGEPEDLRSFGGILKAVFALRSRGLIMFGLVVLILTPIARVIFSLIAFTLQKDYFYTLISAIVLTILLLSFFNVI